MEKKMLSIRSLFKLVIFISSFLFFITSSWANDITKVQFLPTTGHSVRVVLTFSGQPVTPKQFMMKNPARAILDFPNIRPEGIESHRDINIGVVDKMHVITTSRRTRIVLNLQRTVPLSIQKHGKQLWVLLTDNTNASVLSARRNFTPKVTVSSQPIQTLTKVDFRKVKDNTGQVVIETSGENVAADVQQQGDKMRIELLNTRLPARLSRRLDVTDFGTPVENIDTKKSGQNIVLLIHARGDFEQMSYQLGNKFILELKPLTQAQQAQQRLQNPTYKGKRLTLNFQKIKVRAALQLLAEFTGMNIVVSDRVQGSITLRLNNVPWDQALDIILRTQGLAKRQMGNVMLIAPAGEMAAREKQELQNSQDTQNLAPLHSELIHVNYAKASDIAKLLQNTGTTASILSARGHVSVDERTNTLWVQDTSQKLAEVRQFIRKLDIPVRQVLIEARIVNVDRNYEKDLGVQFGVTNPKNNITGSLTGANELAGGTPAADIAVENRLNVSLPAPTGSSSIGMALAKLGNGVLLDLELSALESEDDAEIISSPRLITSNQTPAVIKAGEEIPYQQATSSGATAIAFKDAVLSLEVTPLITSDNKIILTIKVNQDKRGAVFNGVPSIDTREVQTQVLVDNGQTVVLGGIYERTKSKTVKRVPFLGSLPVIGNFFKNTNTVDKRRELLIFITPKIVKQNLAER